MRILAYTDARYLRATRRVVGPEAEVITSPPVFSYNFDADCLAHRDLIYLDLHGQPDSIYLYSGPGERQAALSINWLRTVKLEGAIVFSTTCYLPQTQFVRAFLEAGAGMVIAGDGQNFGTRKRLSGTQVLAQRFIRFLGEGEKPPAALVLAKEAMQRDRLLNFFDRQATRDALQFRTFAA